MLSKSRHLNNYLLINIDDICDFSGGQSRAREGGCCGGPPHPTSLLLHWVIDMGQGRRSMRRPLREECCRGPACRPFVWTSQTKMGPADTRPLMDLAGTWHALSIMSRCSPRWVKTWLHSWLEQWGVSVPGGEALQVLTQRGFPPLQKPAAKGALSSPTPISEGSPAHAYASLRGEPCPRLRQSPRGALSTPMPIFEGSPAHTYTNLREEPCPRLRQFSRGA